MFKFIENYFKNADKYPLWRFILELTALAFVTKLLFVFIAALLFPVFGVSTQADTSFEEELVKEGWLMVVVLLTLFAAFETLTGQWLIIWLSSRVTKNVWIMVIASAAVFAALHVEPILIAATFPIGIILAWSFILKRQVSWWHAFWVTTAIHLLHNLIVSLLVFWSI